MVNHTLVGPAQQVVGDDDDPSVTPKFFQKLMVHFFVQHNNNPTHQWKMEMYVLEKEDQVYDDAYWSVRWVENDFDSDTLQKMKAFFSAGHSFQNVHVEALVIVSLHSKGIQK